MKKIPLKSEVQHDSDISLLVIHPKDSVSYHKDTCSAIFLAILFTIAKI